MRPAMGARHEDPRALDRGPTITRRARRGALSRWWRQRHLERRLAVAERALDGAFDLPASRRIDHSVIAWEALW
jgi:hypothetical protein